MPIALVVADHAAAGGLGGLDHAISISSGVVVAT
jgi:hypothetical protein